MAYFNRLVTYFQGLLGSDNSITRDDISRVLQAHVGAVIPATATAASDTPPMSVAALPLRYRVKSATWCMDGTAGQTTIAASVTNNGTVRLYRLASDGSTETVVGACSNATVAFVSGIPRALTIVGTAQDTAAFDTLYVKIVKAGTGIVTYPGRVSVVLEPVE